MPRRYRIFLLLGGLSILADQLTKYWARSALGDGTVHVIVEGFWHHVLAWNKGVAFSMFEGKRFLLTVVGLGAAGFFGYLLHKTKDEDTLMAATLSLVIGGAIGNIIDRIYFGKVTDFIFWFYGDFKWPVFNIADVVLVVAVGLFFIAGVRDSRREKAAQKEAAK